MRTMAPKTIWRYASASATYDSRRSDFTLYPLGAACSMPGMSCMSCICCAAPGGMNGGSCGWWMACHVISSTNASPTAGRTVQATSPARRGCGTLVDVSSAGRDARNAERVMAMYATRQHATASQKTISAKLDSSRLDAGWPCKKNARYGDQRKLARVGSRGNPESDACRGMEGRGREVSQWVSRSVDQKMLVRRVPLALQAVPDSLT